ncbi:MAG: type II toxin-antitoxin system VapC family toxin [Pleurocapsa sp.]
MSKLDRGILLDTHTWIWLFQGSKELSKATVAMIDKAGSKGKVFISAISVWELSMLIAKGRISLSKPIHQWIEDSLSQPGVNLAPLIPKIAIESSFLPGKFHGDPADRIIVATARINNLILLTRDRKILEYGSESYISCFGV